MTTILPLAKNNSYFMFFVLFFMCVNPTLSWSQDSQAQPTGPKWLVQCNNANAKAVLQCSMSQSVILSKTGARIATVTIGKNEAMNEMMMVIQLPFGLDLSKKVELVEGDKVKSEFTVSTCETNGCFIRTKFDAKLEKMFKLGDKFTLRMDNNLGQPLALVLDLNGFAKSFKLLNK